MTAAPLTIIGAGRVGKTLGKLLHESRNVVVLDVMCRTEESAQRAVDFIGAGTPVTKWSDVQPSRMFLLSVPDDALAESVHLLAEHADLSDSIVFHTSGLLNSDVLNPAKERGARVASVHPIKSFADPGSAAATFEGTLCGIEGDTGALQPLLASIGARFVNIDATKKALYHAATSITSNFLVTLLSIAEQTLKDAGVEEQQAMEIVLPLARGTLDNVEKLGAVRALTGPIARGDVSSVKHHLGALDPQTAAVYKVIAAQTITLAARQGTPADQLAAIEELL